MRNPDNSNPFQILVELEEADEKSPLAPLALLFQKYPIEQFDLKDPKTHPTLSDKTLTEKELTEISRWLREIEGIIEGTVPALTEILTYPNATRETRDELDAILKLGTYIDHVSTQITLQKGLLLAEEASARAALLAAVEDEHLRALVAAKMSTPGEA